MCWLELRTYDLRLTTFDQDFGSPLAANNSPL